MGQCAYSILAFLAAVASHAPWWCCVAGVMGLYPWPCHLMLTRRHPCVCGPVLDTQELSLWTADQIASATSKPPNPKAHQKNVGIGGKMTEFSCVKTSAMKWHVYSIYRSLLAKGAGRGLRSNGISCCARVSRPPSPVLCSPFPHPLPWPECDTQRDWPTPRPCQPPA